MSEADRKHYAKIKRDPVKYAAYLERKRRERKPRPLYEAARKRKWRLKNEARAKQIRQAGHAVDTAIIEGLIVRAKFCSKCGSTGRVQAHHRSYEREHWLIVEWLCQLCHSRADKESRQNPQIFRRDIGMSGRSGGRNRTPELVCEKVVELCRNRMTFKAIAAEVGLCSWTVAMICKQRGEHSRSREVVNEEQICSIRQAFASGFTKAEIVRAVGISHTVVEKIIHQRGKYGSVEGTQPFDSPQIDVFVEQLRTARERSRGITRTKTPEEVSLIRKMYDDGATYDEMQKATGACHMTIWNIVKYRGPYADSAQPVPERRGPHKRTTKHVNHVHEMAARGASYDEIREETRLSYSTIWKILRHPEQFRKVGIDANVRTDGTYPSLSENR